MIFNFDTTDNNYALASLLVYAIYRSRDKKRFKVTPEMWGQIQRFIKASAKRAKTLPEFMDKFQKYMSCPSLNPQWLEVGIQGRTFLQSGSSFIDMPHQGRCFLTEVLGGADDKEVIKVLKNETQFTVLLVRDRLEKEKPIEATFNIDEETL